MAAGKRTYRFPWGGFSRTMKWWSHDPEEPTWCRLLHDLEDDWLHSREEIAARYGLKLRWVRYVHARWDRFRRGLPVMPRVDVAGAVADIHRTKGPKGP